MSRNDITSDRDAYSRLGKTLSDRHSDNLAAQLSVFQLALVNFAVDHGDEIKSNAEFRGKFTKLCEMTGVDPLELLVLVVSKSKNNPLLHIGIGVRVVEICQETRDINGGLISFKELHLRLKDSLSVPLTVTEDDIGKAIETLGVLGKSYEVFTTNNKRWVKFQGSSGVSSDQKRVYELCEFMGGYVTHRLLRDNYDWDAVRAKTVLDDMIMNGFLWIDEGTELRYWEPSWISDMS